MAETPDQTRFVLRRTFNEAFPLALATTRSPHALRLLSMPSCTDKRCPNPEHRVQSDAEACLSKCQRIDPERIQTGRLFKNRDGRTRELYVCSRYAHLALSELALKDEVLNRICFLVERPETLSLFAGDETAPGARWVCPQCDQRNPYPSDFSISTKLVCKTCGLPTDDGHRYHPLHYETFVNYGGDDNPQPVCLLFHDEIIYTLSVACNTRLRIQDRNCDYRVAHGVFHHIMLPAPLSRAEVVRCLNKKVSSGIDVWVPTGAETVNVNRMPIKQGWVLQSATLYFLSRFASAMVVERRNEQEDVVMLQHPQPIHHCVYDVLDMSLMKAATFCEYDAVLPAEENGWLDAGKRYHRRQDAVHFVEQMALSEAAFSSRFAEICKKQGKGAAYCKENEHTLLKRIRTSQQFVSMMQKMRSNRIQITSTQS